MPKEKAPSEPLVESKKRFLSKNRIIIGSFVVIILLLVGASTYFYLQYQKSQMLLNNPSKAGKDEVNKLLEKVGKHYELPKSEEVKVAIVSDMSKLKTQPFFSKAQNGDKVLVYPKAGLALIYRESIDKVVNVGPVDAEGSSAQEPTVSVSQTPSATASVRIALYNGTKINGLTKRAEATLMSMSSIKAEVTTKTNASGDYKDSVVIDLTGKNAQAAKQLAVFAKGKVASLPAGEVKPEGADVLIILGSSYGGVTPTPTP